MSREDARLQTRITLRSPHIMIGELLERLSKQSGVTLNADDWSTAGSDSVTVSLRDVPLADAMNSLWSLFSYKNAEWDWRRSNIRGEKGKYTYTLARPQNARFLAERLNEQVQGDFEAQAQELFAALNMTLEQLQEAAKHDKLLDSLRIDGRVGPGMRVLATLPPETLMNILRNHQEYSIPVSELSPQAQKSLREAWDWEDADGVGQHFPDGHVVPRPRSNRINIFVDTSPDLVAPALYIQAGRGSGEYFGGAYLQGVWQQKMNADWMLPKEAVADSADSRALIPSKEDPLTADQSHALASYLMRFSDTARVPLMARIPHTLYAGTSADLIAQLPKTKTVKAFLDGAGEEPISLQHKWRGGVLLLTCQNWFVGESEEARLPWAEVKRLRDAEAAGDGFLSLNELAHAAHVLNAAQMHSLSKWFPVMENALEWHDILAYFDKTPDYRPLVLSAKGIDYQYPESLVNSQLGIDALRVTHPNLRLQMTEKQNLERKPPTQEIMFVVRDDDGTHGLNGRGFGYEAHEYQIRLKVDEGTAASGKK